MADWDDNDDFCCAICMGILFDPVTTLCAHSYCRKCWLDYWRQDDRCPICRRVQIGSEVERDGPLRERIIGIKGGEYREQCMERAMTVLLVGRTGVGKSALINALNGERICRTNAFKAETSEPRAVVATLPIPPSDADPCRNLVTFRLVDTPGLLSCEPWLPAAAHRAVSHHNVRVAHLISAFTTAPSFSPNSHPHKPASRAPDPSTPTPSPAHVDALLWVDTLTAASSGDGDLDGVQAITAAMGGDVWRRVVVVLTHGDTLPVEGVDDIHDLARRRADAITECMRRASGDPALRPPHVLVSTSSHIWRPNAVTTWTGSYPPPLHLEHPPATDPTGLLALAAQVATTARHHADLHDAHLRSAHPMHRSDSAAHRHTSTASGAAPAAGPLHDRVGRHEDEGADGSNSDVVFQAFRLRWHVSRGSQVNPVAAAIGAMAVLLHGVQQRDPLWKLLLKGALCVVHATGYTTLRIRNTVLHY